MTQAILFEENHSKLDVNCGNLAPKQAQTYHTLRLAAFFIKRDDFFMKLPENAGSRDASSNKLADAPHRTPNHGPQFLVKSRKKPIQPP